MSRVSFDVSLTAESVLPTCASGDVSNSHVPTYSQNNGGGVGNYNFFRYPNGQGAVQMMQLTNMGAGMYCYQNSMFSPWYFTVCPNNGGQCTITTNPFGTYVCTLGPYQNFVDIPVANITCVGAYCANPPCDASVCGSANTPTTCSALAGCGWVRAILSPMSSC